MSKKQKRQYSRRAEEHPAVLNTTDNLMAKPAPRRSSSAALVEFNPDYTDIKAGLKRIGILAVSFLGILIVLSFILPH